MSKWQAVWYSRYFCQIPEDYFQNICIKTSLKMLFFNSGFALCNNNRTWIGYVLSLLIKSEPRKLITARELQLFKRNIPVLRNGIYALFDSFCFSLHYKKYLNQILGKQTALTTISDTLNIVKILVSASTTTKTLLRIELHEARVIFE